MNKPVLLSAVAGLALLSSAQADLVHAYNFSPDAPLADDAGRVEFSKAGEVLFSDEGFAAFDGRGGYLVAEALNLDGFIYTVSFWIRCDDYHVDEKFLKMSILTSTDKDNPFAKGNWWINVWRNTIRFGGKTVEDGLVSQDLLAKPDPGNWHLITLQFNGEDGCGGWANEGSFVPFKLIKPAEGNPPPLFKPITMLNIGSAQKEETAFYGDIADIRIYDDAEWSDEKQAATFRAGPDFGKPAKPDAK